MHKKPRSSQYLFFIAAVLLILLTAAFIYYREKYKVDNMNGVLSSHYKKYKDMEYFSGIALSVYQPNQPVKNYYIGEVAHDSSKKMDATTLFQIGSITKSFTAAIILQLEKENKLKLNDALGKWLPEYSKWAALDIQSLLNMSSGLPNYTDSPLVNAAIYQHPERQLSGKELIQYVYPAANFSPPLRSGYNYCNTGYVLLAMIIEKITQHSFQDEIQNRLINPAQLTDTFYPVPTANKQVTDRIAHGYGYNPYTNPEQVGADISKASLSWAGAAGAVVSTPSDIIKWIKALFVENNILDQQQKMQLMQMISTATGKPITAVTSTEPDGFALGVTQKFDKDIGNFWFYEGQTEGFRALYMYVPSNGIIISAIFNSSVNGENDHSGELMRAAYSLEKRGMKPTSP